MDVLFTVAGADGVPIACSRSGAGTPLLLVHGTTADRTRWGPLLRPLGERFTVYAMDRRGRGASGDAAEYSIEHEAKDVAAVVDAIGPVDVVAHSYGALCSLEAALHAHRIRKLVLYEPPFGEQIYAPGTIERIAALLEQGKPEAVVTTFFLDVARVPSAEVDMLRALPNWPARIAAAHTVVRELRADEAYRFEPARFARLGVETLLLLGGDSPAFFRAAVEAVHAAIATSRVVVMPGQQHAAMNTAPELFLREVLAFLAE
jgi:pimeloyl-ACP methyl ester carboxylesterase